MEAFTRHRLPVAVTLASALTRLLTWGLEPELRPGVLMESANDWELMYRDYGSLRVIARALRGIPAAVLGRMEDHDMTAIPAALVFAIMSAAATGAGLLAHTYPADIRRPTLLAALGLGLGGMALVRSPRRIVLKRLRLPALALGLGALGVAFNMPTEADWQYDVPYVDEGIADHLMVLGIFIASAGCLLIVLASLSKRGGRRLAGIGGASALAGIVLFGAGQIIWGFIAIPIDLAVTATALGAGLAACSLAHVLPRLRHLEVV